MTAMHVIMHHDFGLTVPELPKFSVSLIIRMTHQADSGCGLY